MIKSNPLSVILVFVLFLSALASCWSAAWWFLGARELQSLEYQFQSLSQTSTAMQAIANDALEYSRRNSSIDPLLIQFELKPRPAAAVTQPPLRPAR